MRVFDSVGKHISLCLMMTRAYQQCLLELSLQDCCRASLFIWYNLIVDVCSEYTRTVWISLVIVALQAY